MSGGFAFSLEYGLVEETHEQAGCTKAECKAVHRRRDGTAVLTLSGPASHIRDAATRVLADWPASEQDGGQDGGQDETCSACGAASADGIPVYKGQCPECIADGWSALAAPAPPASAERKALSARELDLMPSGARVEAGAFSADEIDKRVTWVKISEGGFGRWQVADGPGVYVAGRPGVSCGWLAAKRRPTRVN